MLEGDLFRLVFGDTYFAERTLPKKTSSTSSGLIWGTRSTAAVRGVLAGAFDIEKPPKLDHIPLMAWEPNWVALRLESWLHHEG